ncbi:MAG: transporter substrate-binding domain-containing protein [Oscillospiraceae bacterium]|nr:transporter substrate-binding domain-containing protein [Oscillospiraceae bacterium]
MRRRRVDRKKFFGFLLILAFAATLTIVLISSLRGLSERTLKIGLYESSRPLTYVDDKRNISGFEAEYARMLAERLEKKPEIKLYAPEDMAAALASGAVDCVVSARQSVHDYINGSFETAPFISYGLVFIVSPEDESIYGEEDLRGKRAGLIINSDAEQLCEELLLRYMFNVRLYDFEAQPFQDLKLKKNDLVIADELYARYMQKEDPDSYQVLDTVYYMADYGVRLSEKLSQQTTYDIEEAVYGLRDEVSLMNLFLQWFGADLGSQ